jgi:hypothetical protein
MSNEPASLEIEIEEINEDSNTTSTFDNMSEVTSVSQLTQSSVSIESIQIQKTQFKTSFTLDCWTSMNTIAYLGVTIHYINEDFEIKKYLLDFVLLKEKHSGAILAEEFVFILKS